MSKADRFAGGLTPEKTALSLGDRPLLAAERGGDSLRDIVLHREQVFDRPVVALGPDVAAGGGFDELGGHANPLADRLDAALKNIFHAEVATDLADVDRLALIDRGGIASDDEKVLGVGEIGNDVFGDPICEPLPIWDRPQY